MPGRHKVLEKCLMLMFFHCPWNSVAHEWSGSCSRSNFPGSDTCGAGHNTLQEIWPLKVMYARHEKQVQSSKDVGPDFTLTQSRITTHHMLKRHAALLQAQRNKTQSTSENSTNLFKLRNYTFHHFLSRKVRWFSHCWRLPALQMDVSSVDQQSTSKKKQQMLKAWTI